MADRKINTGLTEAEVHTAFYRALHDLTDAQIQALIAAEAETRSQHDDALENAVSQLDTACDTMREAEVRQIDNGAKNRLRVSASSRTHNGITFTVGDDGTVTASGTATANAYIIIASIPSNDEIFNGTYVLSGCPAGGIRDQTYAVYAALGSYTRWDFGDGVSLTPTELTGNISIVIIVYAGNTVENLTFRPMICSSADRAISHDYVPYCPNMHELYQMILALQSGGTRAAADQSAKSGGNGGCRCMN